jgi:hypothetical protein
MPCAPHELEDEMPDRAAERVVAGLKGTWSGVSEECGGEVLMECVPALASFVEAFAWMRRYGSFDHLENCAITGPCTCGYDAESKTFGSVDAALRALDEALTGGAE